MSLMAACGEITPMPVAAIFADTQAEPASVYRWLDWLEKELPFPVHRVTKGDLQAISLTLRKRKDAETHWAKTLIPSYIKNPDGTRGIMQRACTYDFKVVPLTRMALKIMKQHEAQSVVQWIGISVDEIYRMKPSRDERIEHRWPLVDLRISRERCKQWMESNGYPEPPRSACVFCPYHNDREWRRLRDEEPDAWFRAVRFEKDLQAIKKQTDNTKGVPFLHNSLIPLEQIDFSTEEERGQMGLFGNECEGMCGV